MLRNRSIEFRGCWGFHLSTIFLGGLACQVQLQNYVAVTNVVVVVIQPSPAGPMAEFERWMIGHPFILILVDRSRDGRPRIMAHAYTPLSGASYIYDCTSLYFDDIRPHSVYS